MVMRNQLVARVLVLFVVFMVILTLVLGSIPGSLR
jgi:hypothetical protein